MKGWDYHKTRLQKHYWGRIVLSLWLSFNNSLDRSDKNAERESVKKLQKAKQEALVNSTEIRVGRLELNKAIKALRAIIALQNVLKNE